MSAIEVSWCSLNLNNEGISSGRTTLIPLAVSESTSCDSVSLSIDTETMFSRRMLVSTPLNSIRKFSNASSGLSPKPM